MHAPRSAVSALMRVDWKSVGPICRRVPLGHRGVLEARREDRPPPLRHPAHHPVRTIQRLCFVKFLWAVSAFLLVRLSGCF
ncbi:hypothetical protein [Bifidobacterium breve]|uniref:hypothetical protein n=1 Tax=Bifidobacterium breve TaxID=1685 RepID=UPI003A5C7C70